MSFPKFLALLTFCLFTAIAVAGWWKHGQPPLEPTVREPLAVTLEETRKVVNPTKTPLSSEAGPFAQEEILGASTLPADVDRLDELFCTTGAKLPIVQTVTYKSQVPWLKGQQAWLTHYASHYHTSRHFIARSLNGRPDYFKQDLVEGARFNVWHPDVRLQFNLVIDLSLCKMWLYYQNINTGQRELLKSYSVGLGRVDPSKQSGLLTPLGVYLLGNKVAIFTTTTTGLHQGNKTQLIRVFGSRWIPFEKEIGPCSLPAKGYGIHGVPWRDNERGQLVEDVASLGHYESDGCIRLATKDIEELFAIVISKPTVVELVRHFHEARFPIVDSN